MVHPKGAPKFCKNAEIGFEPWEMPLALWFDELKTERAIKAVLLDQHILAGVGNIYADEALYQSGIHPERKASSLDQHEANNLLMAVRVVMEKEYKVWRNHLSGLPRRRRQKGSMQDHLSVYQKTGSKCRKCSGPISRIKVAGRSSHFCPRCQK